MNGNTTTENAEKIGWGVLRWTIYTLITLVILGTTFWALFYSRSLENNSFIIPLRNTYDNIYWKVESLILPVLPFPFNQTRIIQISNAKQKGYYVYSFIGTYHSVDFHKQTITLNDPNNNQYSFITSNIYDTDAKGDPVLNVLAIDLKNPTNLKFIAYSADIGGSGTFSNTDLIKIEWVDNKSLNQIISDYADKSLPLNTGSQEISSIVVLKTNK